MRADGDASAAPPPPCLSDTGKCRKRRLASIKGLTEGVGRLMNSMAHTSVSGRRPSACRGGQGRVGQGAAGQMVNTKSARSKVRPAVCPGCRAAAALHGGTQAGWPAGSRLRCRTALGAPTYIFRVPQPLITVANSHLRGLDAVAGVHEERNRLLHQLVGPHKPAARVVCAFLLYGYII